MCMKHFEGRGYSKLFVQNMENIISNIQSNPSIKLKLVSSCDDICAYCPNNIKGTCQDENHDKIIQQSDKKIIDELGIDKYKIHTATKIFQSFDNKINEIKPLDVCEDCIWNSICFRD